MKRILYASISVVILIVGCKAKGAMKHSDEYSDLLRSSVEELRLRTEAHIGGWGLDKVSRWDLDQDAGSLTLLKPDGIKAVAPAQIIGSLDTRDNSWLWAWDNPSIVDNLKVDVLKVKAYGDTHKIDELTSATWIGSEDEAWAMTALAVKLCGSQGAYRGRADSTCVYITFGAVQLSKSD